MNIPLRSFSSNLLEQSSHALVCVVVAVLSAPLAVAQIVAYEGDVFPEFALPPWEHDSFCTPERWIDDGHLVELVEVGECGPPPGGDQERYLRWLGDHAGSQQFFAEWRMITDGNRSEIPGTAPASLVLGGVPSHTGVSYHFTVSRDQVRLIRDNLLPILFIDVTPDVPHTYRLELYGGALYRWLIDGVLVDSGVPEGPFPTGPTEVISFRTNVRFLPNTTRWDYVRYGRIAPTVTPGDTNCDAAIDFFDVDPFLVALFDAGAYTAQFPECALESADLNADASVDFFDIDPFVECLFGQCP